MSLALSPLGGLRYWTEEDILFREQAIARIKDALQRSMLRLNQAWRFERIEAPIIMPRVSISSSYDDDDIFVLKNDMARMYWALRAETTLGSYEMATHMLAAGQAKLPLCVWQAGPSFRTEKSDGATAAKLRFNQFWQLEFQMIYSADTKADIPNTARGAVWDVLRLILGVDVIVTNSDRLPTYSTETIDLEAAWKGDYKEVASTSQRIDFPGLVGTKEVKVFEIAIGLDRLIAVHRGEP